MEDHHAGPSLANFCLNAHLDVAYLNSRGYDLSVTKNQGSYRIVSKIYKRIVKKIGSYPSMHCTAQDEVYTFQKTSVTTLHGWQS